MPEQDMSTNEEQEPEPFEQIPSAVDSLPLEQATAAADVAILPEPETGEPPVADERERLLTYELESHDSQDSLSAKANTISPDSLEPDGFAWPENIPVTPDSFLESPNVPPADAAEAILPMEKQTDPDEQSLGAQEAPSAERSEESQPPEETIAGPNLSVDQQTEASALKVGSIGSDELAAPSRKAWASEMPNGGQPLEQPIPVLEPPAESPTEAADAAPQAQARTSDQTDGGELQSLVKGGLSTAVSEEVPVAAGAILVSETSEGLQSQTGEDAQQLSGLAPAQPFDNKAPQTASETSSVEVPQKDRISEESLASIGPTAEQSPVTGGIVGSESDQSKQRRPRKPRTQRPSLPTEEVPAPTPTSDLQHLSAQQTEPETTNRTESVIIGGDQPLQVNINGQVRLASEPINVSIWDRRATTTPETGTRLDGNGGKDSSSTARVNSTHKIPWVPILSVIIIALLFVFAVFLICCWPPSWLPGIVEGETPSSEKLVNERRLLATPVAGFYTDDLYGFTIKQPQLPGVTLAAHDTDPDCKGVVFTPETYGLPPSRSSYPRLKVCFVAFDNARPANDMNGQLRALCDHVENNALSMPVRGFMRNSKIGADQLAAREMHLRGQDRESKDDVKLYEAIVEFDQRFYAIEAADLVSNWENTWPVFRSAMDTLQFADNIVIPRDAPIVLP